MENLGKVAQDKITGFKGVITSKHIYITGCNQYGVQPPVKESGELPDLKYFDENRLDIFETHQGLDLDQLKGNVPGCDYREHP